MTEDPTAALITFAARRHGVITRREAESIGVDRWSVARLLRRGVVREEVRGVLLVAGWADSFEQRLAVATAAGGPGSLAIGPSAARLHGVDGFETDVRLRVAVVRGRRLALPGIDVSQTASTYEPGDIVMRAGIRCGGLARTVCDLGVEGPDVVERSVDHFLRAGYSVTWLRTTADRVRTKGRPGIPLVLAELDRRVGDPVLRDTWFERLAEQCLRSPSLPGVCRQYVVRDASGAFVARVDLAIPCVRIAVEAHSRAFHFGPSREAFDAQRERRLAREGWHVEYVGWHDVTGSPRDVAHHLEGLVRRRASDLGVDLAGVRG